MLSRFIVGNFLSFKEKQEFSMLKGRPKNKPEHLYDAGSAKVLKFAALFGANASGKSNFVASMEFARNLILNGMDREHIFDGTPFRLDEKSEQAPSYFEFEILLENKVYSYGLEIILGQRRLISEWLVRLSEKGEDYTVFSRNLETTNQENLEEFTSQDLFLSDLKIKDTTVRKKFDVYKDDMKTNNSSLFLYEMNRGKIDLYKHESELSVFKDIYEWFNETLSVTRPDRPISLNPYFWDTEHKEKIRNMIRSFDTGIKDYIEEDSSLEKATKNLPPRFMQSLKKDLLQMSGTKSEHDDRAPSIILRTPESYFIISADGDQDYTVKTLKFCHGSKDTRFDFGDESDGTQRIFDLLEILLVTQDKVFIIDEIGRSLHPQMTYRLVKLFLDIAASRNVQLVITTHESRLLDFGLLRQDEIWIANKNEEGATYMYSLDEYNVRFDKKIDKAYLEGRYGGVPLFTTIFPIEEG